MQQPKRSRGWQWSHAFTREFSGLSNCPAKGARLYALGLGEAGCIFLQSLKYGDSPAGKTAEKQIECSKETFRFGILPYLQRYPQDATLWLWSGLMHYGAGFLNQARAHWLRAQTLGCTHARLPVWLAETPVTDREEKPMHIL